MSANSKLKKLQARLQKSYKDSVILLAEDAHPPADYLTLPSLQLQAALGTPGFPLGRYIEFAGWESSGKSTFAIQVIAMNQDRFPDKLAVYADYEGSMDSVYMERLGVDTSRVLILKPTTLEEGGNQIREVIETGDVYLVIVDSVDAMIPEIVDNKEEGGSSQKGSKASALGRHIQKTRSRYERNNVAGIYLNQLREKIGAYGDPTYSTGGNALPFYATMRIRGNAVAKHQTGHTLRATIIKNKLAPPVKRAIDIPFEYERGVDTEAETYEMAKELGLFEGARKLTYMGGNADLAGTEIGGSKAEHIAFMRDNGDFHNVLRSEVVSILAAQQ